MHARILAALSLLVTAFSLPSSGQMNFTGEWAPLFHEDEPERLPGPELGDYSGIPINDAARLRGDAYDPDRISVVTQYQCRPHGGDYSMRGLSNMRVEQILDPLTQQLIGIHLRMNFQEMERTIWLDGRERPPELALHTFAGFSTGEWDGNMLNVYTTHLKPSYLRRNGLSRSDKATFTEHWMRYGDYLTVVTAIRDPVFLTEPLVRSQSWRLDMGQNLGRDVCEYIDEVPSEKADDVPNYLPGENPFLHEVADWYGLPFEGARGGSETLYPEYRKQMTQPEKVPAQCSRYCHCGQTGSGCDVR
jgi:hypothetical protein